MKEPSEGSVGFTDSQKADTFPRGFPAPNTEAVFGKKHRVERRPVVRSGGNERRDRTSITCGPQPIKWDIRVVRKVYAVLRAALLPRPLNYDNARLRLHDVCKADQRPVGRRAALDRQKLYHRPGPVHWLVMRR